MTNSVFNGNRTPHIERIETLKIKFQFLITVVCSFILGVLLFGACSDSFSLQAQKAVDTHFSNLFFGVFGIKDIFLTITVYTLPYILAIIIITVLSFSVFNYIASDIILLTCGIKIGYSITLLFNCVYSDAASENIDLLDFLLFAIARLLLLALITCYAYRASLFSYNVSFKYKNGRHYLAPLSLLSYVSVMAAYIGALIVTNGMYCAIAFVLK